MLLEMCIEHLVLFGLVSENDSALSMKENKILMGFFYLLINTTCTLDKIYSIFETLMNSLLLMLFDLK